MGAPGLSFSLSSSAADHLMDKTLFLLDGLCRGAPYCGRAHLICSVYYIDKMLEKLMKKKPNEFSGAHENCE